MTHFPSHAVPRETPAQRNPNQIKTEGSERILNASVLKTLVHPSSSSHRFGCFLISSPAPSRPIPSHPVLSPFSTFDRRVCFVWLGCCVCAIQRKAALFAHLAAMLCSDFENWSTAHLLARMAGEGYGALLPASSGDRGGGAAEAEAGEWLVLRKQLLQWLLAVSARCGDAKASSEYFVGLTELIAALEGEKEKADRECWVRSNSLVPT